MHLGHKNMSRGFYFPVFSQDSGSGHIQKECFQQNSRNHHIRITPKRWSLKWPIEERRFV